MDGAVVAGQLGMETDAFRRLMDAGKISTLCERGTGEDAGKWRVSFYHERKRARFVLDGTGRIIETAN